MGDGLATFLLCFLPYIRMAWNRCFNGVFIGKGGLRVGGDTIQCGKKRQNFFTSKIATEGVISVAHSATPATWCYRHKEVLPYAMRNAYGYDFRLHNVPVCHNTYSICAGFKSCKLIEAFKWLLNFKE